MISLLLFRGGGVAQTGAHSGNVRLWLIELYEREAKEREAKKAAQEQERQREIAEARTARQPDLPAAQLPRRAPKPAQRPAREAARPAPTPEPLPPPRPSPAIAARRALDQVREAVQATPEWRPISVIDHAERRRQEQDEEEELLALTIVAELY